MQEHIVFSSETWTLSLLDQRYLPHTAGFFSCKTTDGVVYALKTMVVRGAPAIGVTAAYGAVIAASAIIDEMGTDAPADQWRPTLSCLMNTLREARPTAVNLAWAIDRMLAVQQQTNPASILALRDIWLKEALAVHAEDKAVNRQLGTFGANLLDDGDVVMTHCNAGALATGGYGTALGVIYAACEAGKNIKVIANETRPFLQGARLTAYELQENGVPVTVACDNACGLLMHRGMVNKVVVGADRIAANGDVANKIGTFTVAVLARRFGIPFYVAAPLSTIDRNTATGDGIPIESRPPEEVESIGSTRILPADVPVFNFAFDVTPADIVTGIITEAGILYPPYSQTIAEAFLAFDAKKQALS